MIPEGKPATRHTHAPLVVNTHDIELECAREDVFGHIEHLRPHPAPLPLIVSALKPHRARVHALYSCRTALSILSLLSGLPDWYAKSMYRARLEPRVAASCTNHHQWFNQEGSSYRGGQDSGIIALAGSSRCCVVIFPRSLRCL